MRQENNRNYLGLEIKMCNIDITVNAYIDSTAICVKVDIFPTCRVYYRLNAIK